MSALMFFEGFKQIDASTEMRGKMSLDVLGLTREDMERFPMPNYPQIVSHLKPISDSEVRHWIIRNTYSPVLKSRRKDALKAFRAFCSDLGWDANEIKETMKLNEEMLDLKPIDEGVLSSNSSVNTGSVSNSGSGCLSVIALVIISTALLAFTLI